MLDILLLEPSIKIVCPIFFSFSNLSTELFNVLLDIVGKISLPSSDSLMQTPWCSAIIPFSCSNYFFCDQFCCTKHELFLENISIALLFFNSRSNSSSFLHCIKDDKSQLILLRSNIMGASRNLHIHV